VQETLASLPCQKQKRLALWIERREVLGGPKDSCPWAVLRCVPGLARFARELGNAVRLGCGLIYRTEKRGAR
jgi:hypothetical protein